MTPVARSIDARPQGRTHLLVSVISHSNPDALARCLDALVVARGRCGRSVGITVLDNASRDGSAEMVRNRYPFVHVIDQDVRRGFGANHNRVVRSTDSDHVMFLNDDTQVAADTLSMLVGFLEHRPAAGIAAPRILDESGTPVASAIALPSLGRTARLAVSLGLWASVQSRGTRRRRVGYVAGCAFLVRRSVLDAVGDFDERFFMYREEVDLCKRVHDGGHEVWFLPDAAVVHTGGASTARQARARIDEAWRSNGLYWRKHSGPLAAWVESRLRGLVYAERWVIIGMLRRLARGRVRLGQLSTEELAYNTRAAWRGPGPRGLREIAEEWNTAAALPDRPEA